jgi:CRP/FNR family cyclic AMP-dependent transcriptional regulator
MVQIADPEDIVSAHPFTARLDRDTVQTIASCCSNAVYHPHDYIAREREPASHFHLIRRREVALEIPLPPGIVDVTFVTSTIGVVPLYAISEF